MPLAGQELSLHSGSKLSFGQNLTMVTGVSGTQARWELEPNVLLVSYDGKKASSSRLPLCGEKAEPGGGKGAHRRPLLF